MNTQVKVIGWLYIIMSALNLLGAACLSTMIFGGGLISQDQTAMAVTGIVSLICGGFLLLLAIPGLIVGVGLLKFKEWARILGIVLSVINLLNFPLGTALGIYALIILLNDETTPLFQESAEYLS
jgi:hypothetical protein